MSRKVYRPSYVVYATATAKAHSLSAPVVAEGGQRNALPSPACQCAISRHAPGQRKIKITTYKTGGITHWPIAAASRRSSAPIESSRGKIGDMSARSRIRAAFAFCNAPLDWFAMATLTFAVQPAQPKEALKRLVRRFNIELTAGQYQWGWVMEFQARGVIHFHLFFEQRFVDRFDWSIQPLVRRGKQVRIIRGAFDAWLQQKWFDAVYPGRSRPGDSPGRKSSKRFSGSRNELLELERFAKFNAGGIAELFDVPDAAGRYVAKEAGKRVQKRLPDGVEAAGRWWWLNPRFKPRPTGTVELATWPWPKAYKHVFNLSDLARPIKENEGGVMVTRPARTPAS